MIEKIDNWFGKPVVITCDEVTAAHFHQVLEWAHHTTRVESILFNTGLDEMQSESIPNVCSGYQSYAVGSAVLGASGTTFHNKIPYLPQFLVLNGKKTLSDLNSGFIPSQMPEETYLINW